MDLNHLHLHVKDIPRSKRFYESYFGFRERVRHGEVLFLRNEQGFDLALAPHPDPATPGAWFHFGFRLDTAQEVRDLRARLAAGGADAGPIGEYGNRVTFECKDPDGWAIEVYWE